MTQDEIIELGKQAGIKGFDYYELASKKEKEATTTFVNLIAAKAEAKEREACAKLVDARLERWVKNIGKDKMYKWMRGLPEVIRARGEA